MTLIDNIRKLQKTLVLPEHSIVPPHNPETAFIGCVDARVDPTSNLGIPRGKALIMRNIAALISGMEGKENDDRPNESSFVEFAVREKKVRDFVVMGHTHCGGIEACLHGADLPHVQRHLAPLQETRDRIRAQGGTLDEQARAMEQEAVRQSLHNLRTYPEVAAAEQAGTLTLHGWVIEIETYRLMVLDPVSNEFKPMHEQQLDRGFAAMPPPPSRGR